MARRSRVTPDEMKNAVQLAQSLGQAEAARRLGVPRRTLNDWVRQIDSPPLTSEQIDYQEEKERLRMQYEQTIRGLEVQIKTIRKDSITAKAVRKTIMGLAETPTLPPKWTISPRELGDAGAPILKISDVHDGETVEPEQVNFLNEYNMTRMELRAQSLVEKVVSLCFHHTINPKYPGLIVNFEGDLVSGDIHEELSRTNEFPALVVVLHSLNVWSWAIKEFKKHFGKVYVTVVAGNHGRTTIRPIFKDRIYSNYDWLLGCMLERDFQKDPDITFTVAESAEVTFPVFDWTIQTQHGDCLGVKGGDGIIGIIGPVVRGDVKSRGQALSEGQPYDILSIGHFHRYLPLTEQGIMANGSLIGYSQYGKIKLRVPYQRPCQALYFLHPELGIIDTRPIVFEDRPDKHKRQKKPWVIWPEMRHSSGSDFG